MPLSLKHFNLRGSAGGPFGSGVEFELARTSTSGRLVHVDLDLYGRGNARFVGVSRADDSYIDVDLYGRGDGRVFRKRSFPYKAWSPKAKKGAASSLL